MGYPPTLVFERAPVAHTRISLKAHDVVLNALLGHLLHNLSNKRYLRDPKTGRPDALGISLPDDFAIAHNAWAFKDLPIDFDDRQSVEIMMQAYDTMCDVGDPYSINAFEATLTRLLQDMNR